MAEYEAYKDSGAEWLGQIPAEWKTGVIGSLYTLRNTKVSDTEYPPLSVTMKGVVPQLETAAKTDAHDARKLVCKGDFAINSRSDRRGSCGVSDYDGSVSLINTVLTPRDSMNPQYYNWLFHTVQFADEFYKQGRGIVDDLWTTRWNEMKRILIPVPTDGEQAVIAEYLAENVARIDAIIAETKASIEEYKAWKASIIYEAVTKGLDPNVEMKESGSEWFGMIPQHWLGMKLRYALENISDVDHFMPESVHEGIPYIMTGDLEKMVSQIDVEECKKISMADYRKLSQKSKIQIDDVIFARYATIGTVSYVDVDLECIISYSCVVVSPKKDVLSGKYLYYYLQSEAFASEVGKYINTNIQGNVGKESMYKAKILLPPITEQTAIVEYLDRKCQTLDSLIAEKEALVKDMEAYKKSLIFEVVTGKRRVTK